MATEVETAPSATLRKLPVYHQPEESKTELDWADLVTLDLSRFHEPGGKEKLAKQLDHAVHKVGFFYITNFGLSQDQIDQQFAIGKDLFALSTEEKLKYRADLEHGNYSGYRPLGSIEVFPGLRDNIEMYNVFKFLPELTRTHPAVIQQHRDEIEAFQKHIAQDTVQKLLVLISLVLELPEDALTKGHKYNDVSDCHLRYMIYHARSAEENAKYQNVYSKGHTDFGSLTPGSITVNIADVLQFWTNGYLKSSVHRVVAPPADQAHLDRLGLLYFLRPAHDLDLRVVDSPLLKRLCLKGSNDSEREGVKAGDWVKARVKGNLDPAKERGAPKEEEVLPGVKIVKRYD